MCRFKDRHYLYQYVIQPCSCHNYSQYFKLFLMTSSRTLTSQMMPLCLQTDVQFIFYMSDFALFNDQLFYRARLRDYFSGSVCMFCLLCFSVCIDVWVLTNQKKICPHCCTKLYCTTLVLCVCVCVCVYVCVWREERESSVITDILCLHISCVSSCHTRMPNRP